MSATKNSPHSTPAREYLGSSLGHYSDYRPSSALSESLDYGNYELGRRSLDELYIASNARSNGVGLATLGGKGSGTHALGSTLKSRKPIENPFDLFPKDAFDDWIGGMTDTLKRALGQEEEKKEGEVRGRDGPDRSVVPRTRVSEVAEAELDGEEPQDSFALVKTRRQSRAQVPNMKGKGRDPREGPGLGGRTQPIVVDSDSSSEDDEGATVDDSGEDQSDREVEDQEFEEGSEEEKSEQEQEEEDDARRANLSVEETEELEEEDEIASFLGGDAVIDPPPLSSFSTKTPAHTHEEVFSPKAEVEGPVSPENEGGIDDNLEKGEEGDEESIWNRDSEPVKVDYGEDEQDHDGEFPLCANERLQTPILDHTDTERDELDVEEYEIQEEGPDDDDDDDDGEEREQQDDIDAFLTPRLGPSRQSSQLPAEQDEQPREVYKIDDDDDNAEEDELEERGSPRSSPGFDEEEGEGVEEEGEGEEDGREGNEQDEDEGLFFPPPLRVASDKDAHAFDDKHEEVIEIDDEDEADEDAEPEGETQNSPERPERELENGTEDFTVPLGISNILQPEDAKESNSGPDPELASFWPNEFQLNAITSDASSFFQSTSTTITSPLNAVETDPASFGMLPATPTLESPLPLVEDKWGEGAPGARAGTTENLMIGQEDFSSIVESVLSGLNAGGQGGVEDIGFGCLEERMRAAVGSYPFGPGEVGLAVRGGGTLRELDKEEEGEVTMAVREATPGTEVGFEVGDQNASFIAREGLGHGLFVRSLRSRSVTPMPVSSPRTPTRREREMIDEAREKTMRTGVEFGADVEGERKNSDDSDVTIRPSTPPIPVNNASTTVLSPSRAFVTTPEVSSTMTDAFSEAMQSPYFLQQEQPQQPTPSAGLPETPSRNSGFFLQAESPRKIPMPVSADPNVPDPMTHRTQFSPGGSTQYQPSPLTSPTRAQFSPQYQMPFTPRHQSQLSLNQLPLQSPVRMVPVPDTPNYVLSPAKTPGGGPLPVSVSLAPAVLKALQMEGSLAVRRSGFGAGSVVGSGEGEALLSAGGSDSRGGSVSGLFTPLAGGSGPGTPLDGSRGTSGDEKDEIGSGGNAAGREESEKNGDSAMEVRPMETVEEEGSANTEREIVKNEKGRDGVVNKAEECKAEVLEANPNVSSNEAEEKQDASVLQFAEREKVPESKEEMNGASRAESEIEVGKSTPEMVEEDKELEALETGSEAVFSRSPEIVVEDKRDEAPVKSPSQAIEDVVQVGELQNVQPDGAEISQEQEPAYPQLSEPDLPEVSTDEELVETAFANYIQENTPVLPTPTEPGTNKAQEEAVEKIKPTRDNSPQATDANKTAAPSVEELAIEVRPRNLFDSDLLPSESRKAPLPLKPEVESEKVDLDDFPIGESSHETISYFPDSAEFELSYPSNLEVSEEAPGITPEAFVQDETDPQTHPQVELTTEMDIAFEKIKAVQAADNPFQLMGNESAVAPGAVDISEENSDKDTAKIETAITVAEKETSELEESKKNDLQTVGSQEVSKAAVMLQEQERDVIPTIMKADTSSVSSAQDAFVQPTILEPLATKIPKIPKGRRAPAPEAERQNRSMKGSKIPVRPTATASSSGKGKRKAREEVDEDDEEKIDDEGKTARPRKASRKKSTLGFIANARESSTVSIPLVVSQGMPSPTPSSIQKNLSQVVPRPPRPATIMSISGLMHNHKKLGQNSSLTVAIPPPQKLGTLQHKHGKGGDTPATSQQLLERTQPQVVIRDFSGKNQEKEKEKAKSEARQPMEEEDTEIEHKSKGVNPPHPDSPPEPILEVDSQEVITEVEVVSPRQQEEQEPASNASKSSSPTTSLKQQHQERPKDSPRAVTRSNCRFHKISLPLERPGSGDSEGSQNGQDLPSNTAEDQQQQRVYFIVPGCSLSNPELIVEEDIKDHGDATMEEGQRMVSDVEMLDFNYLFNIKNEGRNDEGSEVLGILRHLVGVDLLREREVYWLPPLGFTAHLRSPSQPSYPQSPSQSLSQSQRQRQDKKSAHERRRSGVVTKATLERISHRDSIGDGDNVLSKEERRLSSASSASHHPLAASTSIGSSSQSKLKRYSESVSAQGTGSNASFSDGGESENEDGKEDEEETVGGTSKTKRPRRKTKAKPKQGIPSAKDNNEAVPAQSQTQTRSELRRIILRAPTAKGGLRMTTRVARHSPEQTTSLGVIGDEKRGVKRVKSANDGVSEGGGRKSKRRKLPVGRSLPVVGRE